MTTTEKMGSLPDYLVHYVHGDNFRFTDLLHDDYFKAIRMLFNEGLPMAATIPAASARVFTSGVCSEDKGSTQ